MTLKSLAGRWCLAVAGLLGGATCVSVPAIAEEAKTYTLRYQFVPQQSQHFISQNDTEYVVEFSQAKDTVLHTSMFLRQMTILSVAPDGAADVQLMLDRAYMTAKNAEVDSVYDSTQTDQVPSEFAAVHQSLGKPINVRLTPLGKVLPAADGTTPAIQDDLFVAFPKDPVALGGTWKDNFEASIQVANGGMLFRQVKMQRRFTLNSVENGIATIAVSTVCLSPISDPFQESMLIQRKHSGVLKFDLEQGCLVDRLLKIDDKVVGNQGQGSALTVKLVKVDRQLSAAQLKLVDLTKPLVPVRVAADPLEPTR